MFFTGRAKLGLPCTYVKVQLADFVDDGVSERHYVEKNKFKRKSDISTTQIIAAPIGQNLKTYIPRTFKSLEMELGTEAHNKISIILADMLGGGNGYSMEVCKECIELLEKHEHITYMSMVKSTMEVFLEALRAAEAKGVKNPKLHFISEQSSIIKFRLKKSTLRVGATPDLVYYIKNKNKLSIVGIIEYKHSFSNNNNKWIEQVAIYYLTIYKIIKNKYQRGAGQGITIININNKYWINKEQLIKYGNKIISKIKKGTEA